MNCFSLHGRTHMVLIETTLTAPIEAGSGAKLSTFNPIEPGSGTETAYVHGGESRTVQSGTARKTRRGKKSATKKHSKKSHTKKHHAKKHHAKKHPAKKHRGKTHKRKRTHKQSGKGYGFTEVTAADMVNVGPNAARANVGNVATCAGKA